MNTFTNKMFDSIKDALQKNAVQSGTRNILKFEKDKTYTVRLIPNVSSPEKTFFHYYTYDWSSFGTGQYTSVLSPTTFGQRCPITDTKFKVLRNGTDEEKAKANLLRRNERWLINAYVVDDPTNPENNGTLKIIRYGKQLHKIISDAIDGEGSEDFGPRIFDLSENGVNFKIKSEQQGDYISYTSSKFTMPRKIEGMTDTKAEEVYNLAFDLTSIVSTKSQDELLEILDEHFFVKPTLLVENKAFQQKQAAVVEASGEFSTPKASGSDDDTSPFASDSEDDDNLKKLLADLD
jgi:hypothetical protein